jgi:hypothetical protein
MASRGAAARSFGREARWTSQKEGFAVSASIVAWSPPHQRVLDLADRGLDIWFRPSAPGSHLTTPEKSFEALATQRLGPTGAMGAFIGREQATTECCCYSFASGEESDIWYPRGTAETRRNPRLFTVPSVVF